MRILVTNDDGIDAEGLAVLVDYLKAAAEKAEPRHEIIVFAPEGERSGISHGMTLRHPTKVRQLAENTYTCSGTPADCVIVACLWALKGKPDLVISGINRGPNLGTDIIYSGTCAAARQAALVGIPAIAVSCAHYAAPLDYRASAAFVAHNLDKLAQQWKEDCFINVNCPSSGDEKLKARWTIPGRNKYYDSLKCFDGIDGYTYCFIAEGRHERQADSHSDHQAVADGQIALSLVDIHPRASQPAEWRSLAF